MMNEETDKLLEHAVEYASELLTETGEAYPFGAFIDTIGNVHPLEMEIDKKNVPTIGKVVEGLTLYCKKEVEENRMRGYALAYEVAVKLTADEPESDAIAFELHHIELEQPLNFYLSFKTNADKSVEIGELFGVQPQA